jgi:hypothetical protein
MKSSGCCLENRDRGNSDPLRYPQKLALNSPTNGCHSVGIVRLWTTKPQNLFLLLNFVLKSHLQAALIRKAYNNTVRFIAQFTVCYSSRQSVICLHVVNFLLAVVIDHVV